MDKNIFHEQADLLITLLPQLAKVDDFAVHGGTAINFFLRDLPRLSVDIDLTYLPIGPRPEALAGISANLKILARHISGSLPSARVEAKTEPSSDQVTKLFVQRQNAIVKIEPNQVRRGALFACVARDICRQAETVFEKFATARTLSFAEIYGSKICAALDRQHPRDFFDVRLLFQNAPFFCRSSKMLLNGACWASKALRICRRSNGSWPIWLK